MRAGSLLVVTICCQIASLAGAADAAQAPANSAVTANSAAASASQAAPASNEAVSEPAPAPLAQIITPPRVPIGPPVPVPLLPPLLPNPLEIVAPSEVLRVDYFVQPDLPSQQQTEYFNLEHRTRVVITYTGSVKKYWRIGAKLEYEYAFLSRLYQDVRDTTAVHAISIRPVVVYAKNRWAFIGEFGPVLSSTYQSPFSYRDVRLKLFSMLMYTLRPNLALRLGIFGATGFSNNAFFSPGIGLGWRLRENLSIDFFLPLWISIYYRPVHLMTLFFRATVDIVSFDETFQSSGGPIIRDSPVIGYPRTGVGVRLTPYRGAHLEVAGGYSTEGAGSFFEKNLVMSGFRSTLFVQAALVVTADIFIRQ
jgi:hypothetical protein